MWWSSYFSRVCLAVKLVTIGGVPIDLVFQHIPFSTPTLLVFSRKVFVLEDVQWRVISLADNSLSKLMVARIEVADNTCAVFYRIFVDEAPGNF